MARLIYTGRALADVEQVTDFLLQNHADAAAQTTELIIEAVEILGNHPLVGRCAEHDLRELVISQGQSGYIALYSYEEAEDTVLVLAIRHQREAGHVMEYN